MRGVFFMSYSEGIAVILRMSYLQPSLVPPPQSFSKFWSRMVSSVGPLKCSPFFPEFASEKRKKKKKKLNPTLASPFLLSTHPKQSQEKAFSSSCMTEMSARDWLPRRWPPSPAISCTQFQQDRKCQFFHVHMKLIYYKSVTSIKQITKLKNKQKPK